MKLLFTVLFVALFAATQATFLNPSQLNGFQPIIQGGNAVIPLCFPRGFPYATAPPGTCYKFGFVGSINNLATPCLPPIINGVLLPPCQGNFFSLATWN